MYLASSSYIPERIKLYKIIKKIYKDNTDKFKDEEEVFDLFDRRKANSAMILTSNRDVEEWPQVFSDPILANAAIDRMFEQAKIVIFEGPSYRMKGRIIMQDVDIEKHQE
jgi:DNA replication protein DnaC